MMRLGLFGLLFLLRMRLLKLPVRSLQWWNSEQRGPWDEGQKMRIRIVCFVPLTRLLSCCWLLQSKAQLLIYGLDFWQRQMRDEMRSRSLVDFFGTINRRDVWLQKKVEKRRKCFDKSGRWHFRMGKKVSVILLATFTLEVVHDARRFIHLKIGSFDLRWCGENLSLSLFFFLW